MAQHRPIPGPAGRYAPVTRLEIARAIPQGSRRARGQSQWLHLLAVDEQLAELRSDQQRSIRAVARVLARHASWADKTTRPTRAIICALARVAVTTWKR